MAVDTSKAANAYAEGGAQNPPGIAPKGKGRKQRTTGRRLSIRRSKKHGHMAVYDEAGNYLRKASAKHQGRSGAAGGAQTPKAGSKPSGGAQKPGTPREPFLDPFSTRIEADTQLEYGDAERELRNSVATGKEHGRTIDRAFDGYAREHQTALQLHQQATQAARQTVSDAAKASAGASTEALGTADKIAADVAARTGGQTGVEAVGAARSAQAIQAAGAGSSVQDAQLVAQGQAGEQHLGRLQQIIGTGLRQQLHAANQGRVAEDEDQLVALGREKGAFRVSQRGKLEQQATENELATQTLLSEDKQAMMDAELKKLGIDAQLTGYKTQAAIADANNTSQETRAREANETKTTIAELDRTSDAAIARQKNATTLKAAEISASGGSGGKGGKRTFADWTRPGKTVTLTAAEVKKWGQSKSKALSVARSAARLRNRGGWSEEDVVKELRKMYGGSSPDFIRAAAMISAPGKGGLDPQGVNIMRAHFPGGLVPGFKPGTWKDKK